MTPPSGTLYLEQLQAQDKLPRERITSKICTKCGENQPVANFRPAGRGGLFSYCRACSNAYNKEYAKILAEKKREARRAEFEAMEPYLRPKPKICSNPDCALAGMAQPPENFRKSKIHRTGLMSDCAVCQTARLKVSAERHKSKGLVGNRGKYKDDPEGDAYRKQWHDEHKEELNRRTKEWRKSHPEEVRILHINRRFRQYGVDQEWYDDTLLAQGGGCAMCGSKDPKCSSNTFHIDHDHKCCSKSCHACDNCRRGLLCSPCNTRLGIIENLEWKRKAIAYLNKYSKKPAVDVEQGSLFEF